MLNDRSVTEQLKSVREALGKLDAEREALQGIEASLSHWLRLHGGGDLQLPLVAPPPVAPVKTLKLRRPATAPGKVKGSIAWAEAIVAVLGKHAGMHVTTRDILREAQAMGARTTSKDAGRVVEWNIYDLKKKTGIPIERVAPHVFMLSK